MVLTKEQIENWKKVLTVTFGPYALLLKDEDVIALRNKMQNRLDKSN
jgi:hypothetical protein